ncbi:kinesin-like protein KIN-13B [Salvia miltiorrhiza]|uniref:kinesin-like protein KIN-13B n=1 Tax=Salvia miltiorrhiza TaxID=226208 RepID=UPI0025AC0715|nr:kinesin-like protein KIN-13B [Salvia miltiorrhiza]
MNAVGRQRSGAAAAVVLRPIRGSFIERPMAAISWPAASTVIEQCGSSSSGFWILQWRRSGSIMYSSVQAQRTYSGGDLFAEPLTPPGHSRRKNGEELVSPNESSPGLLDLHSFDTELLPEGVIVANRCQFPVCMMPIQ